MKKRRNYYGLITHQEKGTLFSKVFAFATHRERKMWLQNGNPWSDDNGHRFIISAKLAGRYDKKDVVVVN